MNQELLNLIASLYDTAIDLNRWPDVLDQLAPAVGAKSSALLMLETQGRYEYSISATSSNLRPAQEVYMNEYSHHEADHFSRVALAPSGTVVNERDRFKDKALFDSRPDVTYLRDNFGVLERFALKLNDDLSWFECITFQYQVGRGNISPEEELKLRLFLPHIAKVTQLTRMFSLLKMRYSAVLGALDKVQIGMFVVSSDGHVLVENAIGAQIVDQSPDLIKSTVGKLSLTNSRRDTIFKQYLSEVSCTASADADHVAKVIIIGDSVNPDPILLEVIPIRDTNSEFDSRIRGALLTIYDPKQHRDIDLGGVQELFSLTSSELDILSHTIEGRSNRETAEIRGVKPETIKGQLKSIFTKTNSRNRTQLVKRILSYNLPIEK